MHHERWEAAEEDGPGIHRAIPQHSKKGLFQPYEWALSGLRAADRYSHADAVGRWLLLLLLLLLPLLRERGTCSVSPYC